MVRFVDISLRRIKVAVSLCSTAAVDTSDVRAIKFQIELRKQILNDMDAVHRGLKRLCFSRQDAPRQRGVRGKLTAARTVRRSSQLARSRLETGIEKTW
jgi:hypothetical protein